MWTLDKFVNPGHASKVYERFYSIAGLDGKIMAILGFLEMAVLAGFLLGFYKRFCYGAVLLFHAVSTLSSYHQYMAPFQGPNLLFFAAWPMLAACLMLYSMRHEDTLLTFGK
ncbi:MAG: hypothetical protein ACU84J_09915 [Gammaproteobacteria bacterium]